MSSPETLLEFPSFPLWKGLADTPGGGKTLPFSLGWDSRGFIRQNTSDSLRRDIVAAYADDDYDFITAPPGSSRWGNVRGDELVSFALGVIGGERRANILEIGGGGLYIAEKLIREGVAKKYTAVDPALAGCRPAVDGITVIPGYFGDVPLEADSFDVVLSSSCLEHVEDPVSFPAGNKRSAEAGRWPGRSGIPGCGAAVGRRRSQRLPA